MRSFEGNQPEGEGWKHLTYFEHDGIIWDVAVKPQPNTGWSTLKIYARGRAPRKANFWIARSPEGELRGGHDLKILKKDRPEMLEAIRAAVAVLA